MTLFLSKKNLQILAIICLIIFPFFSRAQIQVNSVNTTPITCPNNGTITIAATTTSPPLLYSIIAGPSIQPVQTNPVFNSLLPGNYTIKISDGAGNETTVTATITGTYSNPNFTTTIVKPYCAGESSGQITGIVNPGTGTAPFTWEMVAPSPITVPAQSSNVFNNLPAGNYTMRLTDACSGYKSSVITLEDPNTTNPFYGGSIANKVGCDAMNLFYKLSVNDPRTPLTYKYETNAGVFNYTTATEFQMWGGFFHINQTLPGVDYGDSVKITVYNACGDSTTFTQYINPFIFYPEYSYGSCGTDVTFTLFNDSSLQWSSTGFMPPISYTITDLATNTMVDQGTVGINPPADIFDTYISGFSTTAVDIGHTYQVSVTDGCGDLFVEDYTIPSEAPPAILQMDCCLYACIDSVMGYRIHTVGFTNGKMIFLSGPTTLGSTKPGFEYSDTYTYPDTIYGNMGYYLPRNLTLGTYHFKVIDDCGFELFDSLVVSQVSSLTKEISYKKGCLGENKIYFGAMQQADVTITDLSTNTVIKETEFMSNIPFYNRDSVLNVPSGQYEILIEYKDYGANGINDNIHDCWVIRDTINIEPYQTPEMSTGNAIMCNNTINFVLVPDSTKGVPPYQYEIIAGPQTFPVQASNVFTITQPGTYLARIFDVCGNASTKQITVDTISFDPIEVHSTCFNTSMYFPSSIYYTYEWLMPNGQTHVGDSLILDPVTPADTGTYYISKITNINGCIDTFQTAYHVTLNNYTVQTIPFCAGTDVHIGTSIYNTPGIYSDTLTSIAGCDSIVVTTLTILPQHSDTIQISICQAGSYSFGGNIYQNPGFYSDTLTSVYGCDSISVLHLTVQPYIQHFISGIICGSGSFSFGGNVLTQPGIYTDILSTATCDSIVTLTLTASNYIYNTISHVICEGDQFPFGGNLLSQAGTYRDTLATSACDSIVTLNLTVSPLKHHAISQTICQGQSFSFGGNTYTTSGIYKDTLSTSTCDSIVTLTLNVLPLKYHTVNATICSGQHYDFAGNHYNQSGTYTHTFPTNQCDSIVTLHLTVNPAPAVQIVSSSYETGNGIFVQLNAISNTSPLTYLWASSSILSNYTIPNPTTTVQVPTWVYVTVTDANGCSTTTGNQVPTPVVSTLYAPNAFTPNGDEANNVFFVYGTNIATFKVTIYDRWGELIFESTDINTGWDGTYKGKVVQDDTYVYKISAVGMDYVKYEKTGHVTVIK